MRWQNSRRGWPHKRGRCTMPDTSGRFESTDDLESLLISASEYVRPSDDLRPRVLEAGRLGRRQRRSQQRFWRAAFVVVLLGMLTTSVRDRAQAAAERAMGQAGYLMSEPQTVGRPNPGWEMVESFTELRRRQAEMLSRL